LISSTNSSFKALSASDVRAAAAAVAFLFVFVGMFLIFRCLLLINQTALIIILQRAIVVPKRVK
jgi:hypothetical protein